MMFIGLFWVLLSLVRIVVLCFISVLVSGVKVVLSVVFLFCVVSVCV